MECYYQTLDIASKESRPEKHCTFRGMFVYTLLLIDISDVLNTCAKVAWKICMYLLYHNGYGNTLYAGSSSSE